MAAISDAPGVPKVRVEVARHGDTWTADFNFDRPVDRMGSSALRPDQRDRRQWRQQTWTVTTRGVRLQRRGHYDVLTAERGELPRRVTCDSNPSPKAWTATIRPRWCSATARWRCSSRSSIASPWTRWRRYAPCPRISTISSVPAAEQKYVFRDAAGAVLLAGRRSAVAETTERETYVLFGAASPVETPDMVGIFDPQLPPWIQDSLTRAVPALIGRYTQELGALRKFKPAIMVSWEGATPGISSREGSTLRGLIAMRYAGAGMLKETDEERHVGLWFIAHEAAHFWLGQTVGYEYARDSWITEGGAELLAFRAVAEADPEYDPRIPLNRAINECIRLTERRGVESAR